MQHWQELRSPFREALIDAFTIHSLDALLQYHCEGRRLEVVAGREANLVQAVDDIIAAACRQGWLERLAAGAQSVNGTHVGIQETAPRILAGVAREGKAFYQMTGAGEPTATQMNDLRPYLEWMQHSSRNLPLGPLDPSGRDSELIGLNDVFVALHVDKEGEATLSDGRAAIYNAALAHVHEQSQLVLLGDPGSGKSTLLRYLSLCLCNAQLQPEEAWLSHLAWSVKEKQAEQHRGRNRDGEVERRQWQLTGLVPIFIQLRDFARHSFNPQDGSAIWEFVCTQLPAQLQPVRPLLEALALRKQILFMFDGIDEVPPTERKQVWQAIGAWLHSPYGGNHWVATCRTLSYVEAELPRRHLPVVTLQKLNQEQIDRFITNWYRALRQKQEKSAADADYMTQALQAASREQLRELAPNPMLLTIMAIVQTYEGQLPEERAVLYQRCVETLLLRWQREKEKADKDAPSILQQLECSQGQLEQLLWQLAWKAHSEARQREGAADLSEWDVVQIARSHLGSLEKAEKFLAYTEKKAHLLVGQGGVDSRRFTFPHRTFQEYLAACYLESERKPLRQIATLAEAGDAWREVLNLAFGRLVHVKNDRIKAIDIIADKLLQDEMPDNAAGWRRVWLTGEACAIIGPEALLADETGAEILPVIKKQLVRLLEMEALTPSQRAEAGDALGKLGDPRPGVCTLEPEMEDIPAGEFIYGKDERRTIQKAYRIARYPVTVAQYRRFMEAGGYGEPRYWGGEKSDGWRWRMEEHPSYRGKGPITQPEYWLHPRWHGENRPIVGVSWYEAQAYCAWLTEVSERKYTYRLPTEEEWERAARHTDGREWAWGDEWESGIINSGEAGIGRPTTVGAFPRGVAACGAQDMSGNVWEWTASFYDDDKQNSYCVRGGSWDYDRVNARVAARVRLYPVGSNLNYGFRVVSPVF